MVYWLWAETEDARRVVAKAVFVKDFMLAVFVESFALIVY